LAARPAGLFIVAWFAWSWPPWPCALPQLHVASPDFWAEEPPQQDAAPDAPALPSFVEQAHPAAWAGADHATSKAKPSKQAGIVHGMFCFLTDFGDVFILVLVCVGVVCWSGVLECFRK
jgi:hypothetical protein